MNFNPTTESNLRITYTGGKFLLEQTRLVARMGRSRKYPDALADTPAIGAEDWLPVNEYESLNDCVADVVQLMNEKNRQLRDVYLLGITAFDIQRAITLLTQIQL